MSVTEGAKKVRQIIAKHMRIEEDKVTDNARFRDDLGMDSLEQAELIMEFEEAFGCEIPEAAAEKILTVGDAVKFLEEVNK